MKLDSIPAPIMAALAFLTVFCSFWYLCLANNVCTHPSSVSKPILSTSTKANIRCSNPNTVSTEYKESCLYYPRKGIRWSI